MDQTSNSEFERTLRCAQDGDREALGKLLESCRDYLQLMASRELGPDLQPKVGASDLVQKTFLDAQGAFDQFRGGSPGEFHGWVERILLNNLADIARYYRQAGKRQLDREVRIFKEAQRVDLMSEDTTPSQRAIAKEERAALEAALEKLPEDYRTVIRLRNQDKRPFEEIGGLMQRSTDAAKKLWGRAILALQKELNQA